MPINPELKHLYPPNWREISYCIRFVRAAGKCERCGAPHGWFRFVETGQYFNPIEIVEQGEIDLDDAVSMIVLTCAHLDHDPTNNTEANLAALCQRCHLAHDQQHHLQSRRVNRERRAGQGRLFARD